MSAGFESRSRMRSEGNQPVQPIAVAWNLDPSTPRPLDAQAVQPVECGESVGIREYAGDAGRSASSGLVAAARTAHNIKGTTAAHGQWLDRGSTREY